MPYCHNTVQWVKYRLHEIVLNLLNMFTLYNYKDRNHPLIKKFLLPNNFVLIIEVYLVSGKITCIMVPVLAAKVCVLSRQGVLSRRVCPLGGCPL